MSGKCSDQIGSGGNRLEPDFGKHGMDSPGIEYAQCRKREAANPPPESGKNPAKGQKSGKFVDQGIKEMEKTVTNNSLTPNPQITA
jgi:hypothetical protein